MRKEMGLESHLLLTPDSQERRSFYISVFMYPVMWIRSAASKGKPRLAWLQQREVYFSIWHEFWRQMANSIGFTTQQS